MILSQILDSVPELLEIKNQLKNISVELSSLEVQTWQKVLIQMVPILAIISSFFIGWFVPKQLFRMNYKLEKRKRQEDEFLKRQDRYSKMYGELLGLSERIIHSMALCNYHNIQFKYNSYRLSVASERNKSDINKDLHSCHENYLKELDKVTNMQREFITLLGQFAFYNPKGSTISVYNEISGKNILYDYNIDYSKLKSLQEVENSNNEVLLLAYKYVSSELKFHYDKTIDQIAKEALELREKFDYV